jgi:mono/diheme cytochrome c family protein
MPRALPVAGEDAGLIQIRPAGPWFTGAWSTGAWLGGLLAAALLAAAAPAEAQQSDPQTAQSQPSAGDALQPQEEVLDPWNAPVGNVPQWDPQNSPPALQPRAKRHLEFIQGGVPLEYRSVRSPYPNVTKAIDGGGELYKPYCATCHGLQGRGDGDGGLDLLPSPALLSRLMDVQGTVDEYLMWTISEGGEPFGTAMPAFKNRLTEDQIWQIVAYMRAGFPPVE